MIRALTLLLIAQLALVTWLYWPASDERRERVTLVPGVTQGSLESIEISDGDGQSIRLTRAARGEGADSEEARDRWQLESELPADNDKVAILLRALLEADPGYAVAQSNAAAARFKVANSDFERRVTLNDSTGSTTVFLGLSPAFRKIYARSDGGTATGAGSRDKRDVFVIELNSYDAPTQPGEWLDRSVLAQRGLDSITLYGITFALSPGAQEWSRTDGTAVDPEPIKALVQSLENLQVTGIATPDDDLAQASEVLRLYVGQGAATSRLTVLGDPDSERYYLISEAFSQTFETSAYDAERLIEAARTLGVTLDQPAG